MSSKRIKDIKPHELPEVIHIRVIKKWIPHSKKEDLCYLFVDIHGDAIEAVGKSTKEEYFDSKIKIMSCYAVSRYLLTKARKYMAVTPHEASIRLGERATFIPIQEENLPTYYYNFANYELIKKRLENHTLLTDYIGRIERISEVLTRQEKNLRKVTITDIENNLIEITLWQDKINEVKDRDAVGKILAITSTMVTQYSEKLQLESTSATTVSINPPLPNLGYYLNRFQEIHETANAPISLANLLSHGPEHRMQNRCFCQVTITTIETGRPWYYVNCKECNERAYLQIGNRPSYICPDHEEEVGVKYMYCVNAIIADDTSTTKVVFFNEAMNEILNTTCEDMVIKHGYVDPETMPQPILKLAGMPCLLQLTLRKDGSIAVNKAHRKTKISPLTPDPKMLTRKRQPHELSGKEADAKKPRQ